MSFARIVSAQPAIPHAHIVNVETDVTRGLHAFTIVGLPDKAVEEARDRVASAVKNSGFTSPKSTNKKIVVSLAPAALKKEGAVFDVPVALSYLRAVGDISFDASDMLFVGELALDGSVRPIRGALSLALAARDAGISHIFVPKENEAEAALVSGISVYGIDTLSGLVEHLNEKAAEHIQPTPAPSVEHEAAEEATRLEDIRGQEHAKRGLEIAAAGRHNIAFYGPPGTGKTLLARALTALLPPLSPDEMIEVTAIHSFAGALGTPGAVVRPPFRAPHHTSSYASVIGGGTVPRPGEATLAHRGVLFLDEFPEFRRDVINALRQPIEDRVVHVARAHATMSFPSNFMLIAALNPCPCGKFGTNTQRGREQCTCLPGAIEQYRRKFSGPIADRIDMWIHVGEIPTSVLQKRTGAAPDETTPARRRVANAHERQSQRFQTNEHLVSNADMGPRDIDHHSALSSEAEEALGNAARTLGLSPRGYHRTIKLARTIADVAESEMIEEPHMLEALQYRPKERF